MGLLQSTATLGAQVLRCEEKHGQYTFGEDFYHPPDKILLICQITLEVRNPITSPESYDRMV
jgi:hypothetical protein